MIAARQRGEAGTASSLVGVLEEQRQVEAESAHGEMSLVAWLIGTTAPLLSWRCSGAVETGGYQRRSDVVETGGYRRRSGVVETGGRWHGWNRSGGGDLGKETQTAGNFVVIQLACYLRG
jgi:hypothetical protein